MNFFTSSKKDSVPKNVRFQPSSLEETEGLPPPPAHSNAIQSNYMDVYEADDDTSSQGTVTAYDIILKNLANQAEDEDDEKPKKTGGILLQAFGHTKQYADVDDDEDKESCLKRWRFTLIIIIVIMLAMILGALIVLLFQQPATASFIETPSNTTSSPTRSPITPGPTRSPVTSIPTGSPTSFPTGGPTFTLNPTNTPTTLSPTALPTTFPSSSPSSSPTLSPTDFPTTSPSFFPTTLQPTENPTTEDLGDNVCADAPDDTWKYCVSASILSNCVYENGVLVPGGEDTYVYCEDKANDRIYCRCPNGLAFDETYGCSKISNVGDGCS